MWATTALTHKDRRRIITAQMRSPINIINITFIKNMTKWPAENQIQKPRLNYPPNTYY